MNNNARMTDRSLLLNDFWHDLECHRSPFNIKCESHGGYKMSHFLGHMCQIKARRSHLAHSTTDIIYFCLFILEIFEHCHALAVFDFP